MKAVEDYVAGLGLDAYVVGGAVRDALLGLESKDADFLVPGVDHAGLRAALAPHGRVADLEGAGHLVGARVVPRRPRVRRSARRGAALPPRPGDPRARARGHRVRAAARGAVDRARSPRLRD